MRIVSTLHDGQKHDRNDRPQEAPASPHAGAGPSMGAALVTSDKAHSRRQKRAALGNEKARQNERAGNPLRNS